MPLTPFHLGPGLFFGMLFLRFVNIYAFLIGSVIMDLEPLTLIIVKRCYFCEHHPFLHTVIGGILGSLAVAFILKYFEKPLQKLSAKLNVKQSFSMPAIYLSCFSAWILHIFFDSLTHSDVHPLWPSTYNPILIGTKIMIPLHLIFFALGVIGLVLFCINLKKSNVKR